MNSTLIPQLHKLITKEILCDDCLGRLFGLLSHGLTNRQRGSALRITLSLLRDIPIEEISVEDTNCKLCNGLYDDLDNYIGKMIFMVEGYEFNTYLIGTRLPTSIPANQNQIVNQYDLDHSEDPGHAINRKLGRSLESGLGKRGIKSTVDFSRPDVQFTVDFTKQTIDLSVRSTYYYGRYNKLSRTLPQTKWDCPRCNGRGCSHCNQTGKMYPRSVATLIQQPLIEASEAENAIFHGAGREDVDVKMRGQGRPFILELVNPKTRSVDLESNLRTLNEENQGLIKIRNLQKVTKDAVSTIKEARMNKIYRAVCTPSKKVSGQQLQQGISKLEGKIRQKTPSRVNHRRATKVRTREVKRAEGNQLDPRKFELTIQSESGLYIKELIHADKGRTKPSLATILGNDLEVKKLDVLEVLGSIYQTERGDYAIEVDQFDSDRYFDRAS